MSGGPAALSLRAICPAVCLPFETLDGSSQGSRAEGKSVRAPTCVCVGAGLVDYLNNANLTDVPTLRLPGYVLLRRAWQGCTGAVCAVLRCMGKERTRRAMSYTGYTFLHACVACCSIFPLRASAPHRTNGALCVPLPQGRGGARGGV